MKGIASSLITGLIILALVFLFVRPGSQGVSLVSTLGTSLSNLFGAVTGGGGWASTGGKTSTK
jgi:hypothetical protein